MTEEVTEYIVIEYIDDLEEALALARKAEFSANLIKGLETLHGDLVEVGNLVTSPDRIKRIKADVEKLLEDLIKACQEGEEGKALGTMRQLRDKVHTLKAIWSKE